MNTNIVRETSSEIRAIARNALRNNWVKVAMAMGLYYVMMITIPSIIDELIPAATINRYYELTGETLSLPIVSSLYNFLLTGPFELGLASFLIYFFRRKDTNPGYIFNGFENFIKAFCLVIVMGFFIFLWTLLFIIPGFIAAIRYSQAFYIMADHSELGVMECINRSKAYMSGNVGKYFGFCLTFVGWAIVSVLPTIFIPELTGIAAIIVDVIVSIPYFFFLAYFHTSKAAFYELLTGNLVAHPNLAQEDYNF